MAEHHLKAQQLVDLLGVSKGYVSDILNYKKGLSKEVIRNLATHFKVRQETFNRAYKLKIENSQPEFNPVTIDQLVNRSFTKRS